MKDDTRNSKTNVLSVIPMKVLSNVIPAIPCHSHENGNL